jgi:hypothetical protein
MAATVNSTTFLSVADKPQPSSSAGLVRRDIVLNCSAGTTSVNYSGPAAGIGTIIAAQAVALGSSSQTFSLANTISSAGAIAALTGGVTFVPSSTVGGCNFLATIVSTA